MTDPIIHQLYCTHCTYGTSALHRHTGNIKDQPFEYSTRAGSIESSESHQRFQQFEKLYFRGLPLPSDTPTEARQRFTAASSPWRRLVAAGIPGGSLLAHVAYRATDTSKPPRTGSYFAHLLLHNPVEPTERVWSLTDALQMWGAKFWVVEDGDDLQHELKTVSDLRQLPGFGKVINDGTLLSFLTTPQDGVFNDGPASPSSEELSLACAIPQRWRQRPVEDRRALFTSLLQSVLNLKLDRRERLSLAIEPSLAALLFYGVIRLLPRTGLVDELSVSTFEPHTEASSLVLTATDFYDPATSDLLPAAYRGGVAINTHNSKPLPASPPTPYVSTMLGKLLASGKEPDAVDRLRDELRSNGLTKIRDCEQYLGVEDLAERLVQPSPSNPVSERDLSGLTLDVARQKFRQLVLNRLRVLPEDNEIWSALRKSPSRVTLIAHVLCEKPALEECGAVLKQLCACLPEKELPQFFDDRQIPAELRHALLKHEVEKTTGELPAGCDSLWLPVKSGEAAESPLLERLFVALDAGRLETFCESVVKSAAIKREVASPRVLTMLTYLAKAAKHSREKEEILTQRLNDERFGEEQWDALLFHYELRSQLFEVYPPDKQFLREKLLGMLDKLPSSRNFPKRLDVLKAAESRLDDRRQVLSSWHKVRSHLQDLNEVLEVPSGLIDRLLTGTSKRRLQEIGANLALDCQWMLRDQYRCPTADSQLRALKTFVRANSVSGELPNAFLRGLKQALRGSEEPVARVRDEREEASLASWALAWLRYAAVAILAMVSVLMVGVMVVYRNPDFIKQFMTASENTEPTANNLPNGQGKSHKKDKPVASTQPKRGDGDSKSGIGEQQKPTPPDSTVAANAHAGNPKEGANKSAKNKIGSGTDNKSSVAATTTPLKPVEMPQPVPKDDSPTGDGKGVTSPKDLTPTKLRGPTWKPDKLYIAKPSGPRFDEKYKHWKTEEAVVFLTLHGPQLFPSDNSTKPSVDSGTWPLILDWKDDRTIEVSTRLPEDAAVEEPSADAITIWRIVVEPEGVTCRLEEESLQRLLPVIKKIEASWRNCVLGIHFKGDDPKKDPHFFTFDDRSTSRGNKKNCDEWLQLNFQNAGSTTPLDDRLWAVGGDAELACSDVIVKLGDGKADSLFTGKWDVPGWPPNRAITSACVHLNDGTAKIEIMSKRELKKNDKGAVTFKDVEVSYEGESQKERLQTSLRNSLGSLHTLLDSAKDIKVIETNTPPAARNLTKSRFDHCRVLCTYFDVKANSLDNEPIAIMNDQATIMKWNEWKNDCNTKINEMKRIVDKLNPREEELALKKVLSIVQNKEQMFSGSIFRVINHNMVTPERRTDLNELAGRVGLGIAVEVATYK